MYCNQAEGSEFDVVEFYCVMPCGFHASTAFFKITATLWEGRI